MVPPVDNDGVGDGSSAQNSMHPNNIEEHPDDPSTLPGHSRSSSPSGSDYEKEQRKLKALRPPSGRRVSSLTIEEQDQDDEQDFEHDIAAGRCRPSRPTNDESGTDDSSDEDFSQAKKRKGKQTQAKAVGRDDDSVDDDEGVAATAKKKTKKKGKGKAPTKGDVHVAEEDEGDGDDDAEHAFKPGPVPEVAKDAVFIAHAEYQRRIQDIANEYKKPVSAMYQLVGQALPVPRFTINGWNAFQVWYGVNGDETKPKEMSSANWTKVLVEKYEEYLQDKLGDDWEDQGARTECLKPLVDWYKERLGDHVENIKVNGHCKKMLLSTTDKFIQYSTQAYEMYGIHVFRFTINTQRDEFGISHSTSWGGSPAFAAFRQAHKSSIRTQLNDYEAMFRIEEMKERGLDVAKAVFPIQTSRKEDELSRDFDRRTFKDLLVGDYGRILMLLGKLSAADAKNLKMPWAAWADAAYEFRSPECIAPSVIHECNRLRRQAEIDETVTDYVQVVPWSDEHLLLDVDDVDIGDVPLVVNTDGRALVTVLDSSKFWKAADKKKKDQLRTKSRSTAKAHVRGKKCKMMPANVSSDEDDDQEERPPPKKHHQAADSRSRTQPSRHRDQDDKDDDDQNMREVIPSRKKHRDAEVQTNSSRHWRLDDDDETRTESRSTQLESAPKHASPPRPPMLRDPATLERWARENGWTRETSRSRRSPQNHRSPEISEDEAALRHTRK
ncbi:hypothetical protein Hypma_014606 [Hypsizygus marmoreus]|uniref:Uncharacterized protein n=1 Tax=Hypsizygus marmoreus TaxID=39966 RepID=A0A369JDS0_HYPMA|nr:hypothetical protein Hypma_014606 [Hypsizygus marmoreus]